MARLQVENGRSYSAGLALAIFLISRRCGRVNYNYFQTKEQLVTDRDQLIQDELSRLIRTRAPGTTPAAAIRPFVLDTVEGIRRIPPRQWRGELGYLAAISPTVHRLALEMSDRQATALATALAETGTVAPEIARLRGIALAGVFQIIIAEAGRRTREGQSQNQIADELRPAIEAVLDDLDAWLTPATDRLDRAAAFRHPTGRDITGS